MMGKDYVEKLKASKNMILRGAPGTGKTFLAKNIAAEIVSNGSINDYSKLSERQLNQVGFTQFHPSYDYTDFIEGFRPVATKDGIGFELKDGIFKEFINKARKNSDSIKNSIVSLYDKINQVKGNTDGHKFLPLTFFEYPKGRKTEPTFSLMIGNEIQEEGLSIKINHHNLSNFDVFIPMNICRNMMISIKESVTEKKFINRHKEEMSVIKNKVKSNVKSDKEIEDIFQEKQLVFEKILKRIFEEMNELEQERNYVFIIDEINRGEISKIFGELFFSIDPGYRGKAGAVSTQYSNVESKKKRGEFYIPENVYIIGTMNDIDRSVDSFDFAMRRRFRFVEIKATDSTSMLDVLDDNCEEAIKKMNAINQTIDKIEGLNANYHVGPAYFMKLKDLDEKSRWDDLWNDFIEPLLKDYVCGMQDEEQHLRRLKDAYDRANA